MDQLGGPYPRLLKGESMGGERRGAEGGEIYLLTKMSGSSDAKADGDMGFWCGRSDGYGKMG